jgi:hypothetical protein
MARTYRILGQSNPNANVLTTLYTVPASNSAIISSLVIANLNETDGTGNSFTLSVNTAGVGVSNSSYIAYRVNCPVKDTVKLTLGITLNAGSVLSANANSGNFAFTAFGTEIY